VADRRNSSFYLARCWNCLEQFQTFSAVGLRFVLQLDICIVMAIGYFSVSRDGKSLLAAAVATGKAALVGSFLN